MNKLLAAIKDQYRLDWHGTHGWPHWCNVNKHGQHIAMYHGLNANVIQLFSIFHDAARVNENEDHDHGRRGANLAIKLRDLFPVQITDDEMDALVYACAAHTNGGVTDDLLVGACWDADRLDLTRVGIRPSPKLMSTEIGRSLAKK